jgi:hypothetical protein
MTRTLVLCLLAAPALGPRVLAADASGVAGTWRGESLCAIDASGCHNEKVVYYIKDVQGRPDVVVIQADKIVDGKAITMGTGEWHYDRTQYTLEWRSPPQVWLLKISGHRMEGTLTMADQTVFRKIALQKDE